MDIKVIQYLTMLGISVTSCLESPGPNIVFILVDDVGWADFNYNVGGESSIPTPNIDRLAESGLKLKNHYVQATCTPSRAALMTGRYASNTGLSFAIFPGSVAGLPDNMATMPQLLRKAGYSAHIVGKWHLGHAQRKQGPIGRGFESHTGSLMLGLESYTKLIWKNPLKILAADWGRSFENGSYAHMAEPRHATFAITEEAVSRMKEYEEDKPLFLYVSYNTAHSPLQPEPEWEAECSHIPHLWRRQYCGMVVGLDKAIGMLVEEAKKQLGENTVIVVSADNGGSVWYGGLNAPLRSGKLTPFEGGVRVPAFAVDLSGKYLKVGGAEFNHIFHISDWLPTFLSWAGASGLTNGLGLDGLDQSTGLMYNKIVREEVLLELFTATNSHDGSESAAYRKGNYKIIHGNIRDPHWYKEPTEDKVATSDPSLLPRILENFVRFIEFIFGNGKGDAVHGVSLNLFLFGRYAKEGGLKTMLFDLEKDPEERNDISAQHPELTQELFRTIQVFKDKLPYQPKYWMVDPNFSESHVSGDCSGQNILSQDKCIFTHHWLPDNADPKDEKSLGLKNTLAPSSKLLFTILIFASILFVLTTVVVYSCCCSKKEGSEKKQN